MDTNVAGLNKVVCIASGSSFNGKAVSITDGVNTWSGTIANIAGTGYACVFMIPSMPAPAKNRYTVRLHNGDTSAAATYTRVIDLGFGDSVRIGLYTDDELVKNGSVPVATSSKYGGVKVTSGTSNGVYLNSGQLQTQTATASQMGSVKVGNRMEISSGAINPANITYGTSSKTDGSSSLTTGTIYCQY